MADDRPVAVKTFEEQDLGEEFMLYDEPHDRVHVLNRTARFIWDLCDGTRTGEEILARVRQHFDGSREKDPAADVQMILAVFRKKKLIE
jgi:hypothetical protein